MKILDISIQEKWFNCLPCLSCELYLLEQIRREEIASPLFFGDPMATHG